MITDLAALRRKHIKLQIDHNPVEIAVTRTERVPRDGGFEEKATELGPYRVRVFLGSRGSPQSVSTIAGTKQLDRAWGLLGLDVDLQAGPNVRDEFEVAGLGRFLVKAVYPQVVNGVTVGVQAELEKVS